MGKLQDLVSYYFIEVANTIKSETTIKKYNYYLEANEHTRNALYNSYKFEQWEENKLYDMGLSKHSIQMRATFSIKPTHITYHKIISKKGPCCASITIFPTLLIDYTSNDFKYLIYMPDIEDVHESVVIYDDPNLKNGTCVIRRIEK